MTTLRPRQLDATSSLVAVNNMMHRVTDATIVATLTEVLDHSLFQIFLSSFCRNFQEDGTLHHRIEAPTISPSLSPALFLCLVSVRAAHCPEEPRTLLTASRIQRKSYPPESALPRYHGSKTLLFLLCSTSVDSKPKMIGFVGSMRHSTSYELVGAVAYGILLEYQNLGMPQRL